MGPFWDFVDLTNFNAKIYDNVLYYRHEASFWKIGRRQTYLKSWHIFSTIFKILIPLGGTLKFLFLIIVNFAKSPTFFLFFTKVGIWNSLCKFKIKCLLRKKIAVGRQGLPLSFRCYVPVLKIVYNFKNHTS